MTFKTHISIENLNVFYDNNQALKNISVDFPDKKITAIIGPSGCGKTTLLKSFNRLLDVQEGVKIYGRVLVDGENIFDPKAEVTHIRKKMGLLSQKPYPLPMSIYDNVAYGLRIQGKKNKKELDRSVTHYLKEASLWEEVKDRLHTPASKLSVGQQQRLCLARGLAVEPEIILGDEPTGDLDSKTSADVMNLFRRINKTNKQTFVLVTHSRWIAEHCDYIVHMTDGKISAIEQGPFKNPKEKE